LERDEGDGLDVPSINQLRYVSYHLLKSLTSKDVSGDLKKALNHVHRSLFDAHEAQSIDGFMAIDKFRDDYRLVDVTEAIPDYIAVLQEVATLRNNFKSYPKDDERASHYQTAVVGNKRLQEIRQRLEHSRTTLNAKLRKKRSDTIKWAVSLVAGGFFVQLVIFLLK
ncbi:MAG: hypothetical protein Q8Q84_17365, partial [Hydrogenophaga sp.]|nr:hypothetical protein [Hydrogenophaga sp.]